MSEAPSFEEFQIYEAFLASGYGDEDDVSGEQSTSVAQAYGAPVSPAVSSTKMPPPAESAPGGPASLRVSGGKPDDMVSIRVPMSKAKGAMKFAWGKDAKVHFSPNTKQVNHVDHEGFQLVVGRSKSRKGTGVNHLAAFSTASEISCSKSPKLVSKTTNLTSNYWSILTTSDIECAVPNRHQHSLGKVIISDLGCLENSRNPFDLLLAYAEVIFKDILQYTCHVLDVLACASILSNDIESSNSSNLPLSPTQQCKFVKSVMDFGCRGVSNKNNIFPNFSHNSECDFRGGTCKFSNFPPSKP